LSGWLKETHGADEDDFSLQSVADDYAALVNLMMPLGFGLSFQK
jgi:hypothetical protein